MEQVVAGDDGVAALFDLYYLSLVRLAVQLVDDLDAAEDVVQDVFARLDHSRRLEDPKRYLQVAVVNRSRSVLRRRVLARAVSARRGRASDAEPADAPLLARADRDRVVEAIRCLPVRQREVVVLRYYEDLSVTEIASMLRCSASAVSSALTRALDSLTPLLGGHDE